MTNKQSELLNKLASVLLEVSEECEKNEDFHKEVIHLNFFSRCIDEIALDIKNQSYYKKTIVANWTLRDMEKVLCEKAIKYICENNVFKIHDVKYLRYKEGKFKFIGYEQETKEKVSCILYAYDFSVTLRFEKTRDLEFYIGNLIHS
ncbi:hypothetical protein AB3H50_28560 [Bacillus pacificus]|uniref:Uncharacterized protein n=2 Tax=Bacillus cereus TaxID=1396 RepID=A0A2A7IBX4_BACCE|nr:MULTISPECIES: hypothetical protein [Bacillus cereus group]EJP81513.1 hypothetical protein IC1_06296 [Bacillus cereus VD022]EOQ58005.1 hypothetical protein IAY_06663 [Bacillus cereus TIAC219]OJE43680.1 hypothetical protein BAQ44_04735 [Bacillus mobilis]PEC49647.1 hypothetical protein CON05_30545 [Bacillus cereus]PFE09613.1 hypothetical protein CN307_26275 [Bacillus cereus]